MAEIGEEGGLGMISLGSLENRLDSNLQLFEIHDALISLLIKAFLIFFLSTTEN